MHTCLQTHTYIHTYKHTYLLLLYMHIPGWLNYVPACFNNSIDGMKISGIPWGIK